MHVCVRVCVRVCDMDDALCTYPLEVLCVFVCLGYSVAFKHRRSYHDGASLKQW